MLQHIIPSKARRKILQLFYLHYGESIYLRKVVREVNEEVNAVKRELDILANAKVLLREKRLNKVFYTVNKSFILHDEFLRIFTKTGLLPQLIYKNQSKIGKLKYVVLSTKYAKNQPIKEDEIYLMVIGVVVIPEIESIIKEAETIFGRSINYTVMTDSEFVFRKKNKDPFIWRFLREAKVMIVGSEEELLK